MKIINPFDTSLASTQADPKLSPPPFSFASWKKALKLIDPHPVIRFEVNQKLFDEISVHIKTSPDPQFTLFSKKITFYNRYDRIPIILVPDQVEPLKIIKRRKRRENNLQAT